MFSSKQCENSSSTTSHSSPNQRWWSYNSQTRPGSNGDLHTTQSLLCQKSFGHLTGHKQQVCPQGMNLQTQIEGHSSNRNTCLLNVVNCGQVESVEKLFCILSSDIVDISLKRSAAEQLSVVLQGEFIVTEKSYYLNCRRHFIYLIRSRKTWNIFVMHKWKIFAAA